MLNYTGRVGYGPDLIDTPLSTPPNLLTGDGRMKYRGPDKTESNHKRKKKSARTMAKRSRRRGRQ